MWFVEEIFIQIKLIEIDFKAWHTYITNEPHK